MSELTRKKTRFSLPHVFALLVILILLAAVASWFVPAGEFDRVENEDGRMVVVPGSYHHVEENPVNLFEAVMAIPKGLVDSALIVFAVFIIGGAFGIIEETRIISVLVDKAAKRLSGKETLMIVLIMVGFSVICAFIGLLELSMFYIPILIPICLALRLDSVTAVAIALISTAAGFAAALTNPFTIAIAQDIGGLELYSGMGYRSIVLATITTIGILYVLNYVRKIKKNPEISITYERDKIKREELRQMELPEFNGRLKLVAAIVILGFVTLIYGIVQYKWYLLEISTVFIITGVLAGLAAGLNINTICEKFVTGLKSFVIAAFAVGIARAITVVLEDARILDTVVYGLSNLVETLPSSVSAVGMLITQMLLNFLIPSGSGQTVASMPIMFPLADLTGVSRQTAILALQFGDGFSNIFYPTLGFLWACIGMAGIKYEQWFRFILPLMVIWYATGAVFLVIAQAIGWS